MSLVMKTISAPSSVSRSHTRTRTKIVCSSMNFKEIIAKRTDMDKKRIERMKEIGNTLDHIARTEVQLSGEAFKTYFPFIENLKDFKGITKDDIENFFTAQKKKCTEKSEETK